MTSKSGESALCAALLGVVCTVASGNAAAVYVRHDRDVSAFEDLAAMAQFEAAGFFTTGCSGVLIGASTVLTAAHCATSGKTSFGFGAERDGARTYEVASMERHPLYAAGANGYQYDLAIASLLAPVEDVIPATITPVNLIGRQVTMVGYGGQGTGLGTPLSGATDRLAATNTIDTTAYNLWAADFDSPASNKSLIGGRVPTAYEGQLAGGDSGSPLFWSNFLVGIGAYTFCQTSGCRSTSVYGTASLWVRLDLAANRLFIDQALARAASQSPANSPVPVPPAGWLLGTALLGMPLLRRGGRAVATVHGRGPARGRPEGRPGCVQAGGS